MQESVNGVVDLSSQYSLAAFREFMAYIYYNKRYSGSYLPLLFNVDVYTTYIDNRVIKLITEVPISLMVAAEA